MTTQVQKWLKSKIECYPKLQLKEIQAIQDFTLLWSLYEMKVLNTNADIPQIQQHINSAAWDKNAIYSRTEPSYDYFRNRYLCGNHSTERFDGLNFRNDDYKNQIINTFSDAGASVDRKLIALLMIIYRLRNNCFHGVKWKDGFEGQIENFNAANTTMMAILEACPNLNAENQ